MEQFQVDLNEMTGKMILESRQWSSSSNGTVSSGSQ